MEILAKQQAGSVEMDEGTDLQVLETPQGGIHPTAGARCCS